MNSSAIQREGQKEETGARRCDNMEARCDDPQNLDGKHGQSLWYKYTALSGWSRTFSPSLSSSSTTFCHDCNVFLIFLASQPNTTMYNELAPILPTVPGTSGIDDLGGLAPSSTSTPEINGNLKRKRNDSTASLDAFIAGTVDIFDASSLTAAGEFTDLNSDFWKFVHDSSFTSFGGNDNSAQMDAPLSSVPGAPTSLTTGLSTGINTSVDGARVSCEEWPTNPVLAAATQGDDVPVTSTSQTTQPSTQPTNYDELFGGYHSPIPNAGPSSTPAQDDLEAPLSTNNAEQADSNMLAEWQALLDVVSNDTSLAQASTPAAISDIQKIFLEGYEANSSGVPPSTYSGADIPFVGPADGPVGVSQVIGPLETMQEFSRGQLSSDTITNVPEAGLNFPDQLSAFPGVPEQGFNNCLTPSNTSPFPIYPGSFSHASEFRRMYQPPLVQHFPDFVLDTDASGLYISTYRPHQAWYGIAHYFGVAPPPPATTIHSPFYDALINFISTWNHNRGPLIVPSVLYDPPKNDILPIEIQRFMNQYFPDIPRPPPTYLHYVSWWDAVWIARECFRKDPQCLEKPLTTMGPVSFGQQSQPGPSHVPTTTTTIYWNPTPHDQTPVNMNLNPAGHASSSQTPLPTAEDLAKMEPHSIFVIETGQRERRPRKKARRG